MDSGAQIAQLYGGRVRVRVCGLLEQNGALLLVKHIGIGPAGYLWLPPGGGVEFGETLAEALIREFEEECNLKIDVKEFFHIYEYVAPPLHAIEHFYEVIQAGSEVREPVLGHDPEAKGGQEMLTEMRWWTKQEVLVAGLDKFHKAVGDYWGER